MQRQRICAGPSQHAGKTYVGEICCDRDTDQRVLLLHGSFGRCDIGAPLEQRRRDGDRDFRNCAAERMGPDTQFGGRAADQYGDGMLELRTLRPDVEKCRFGIEYLGFGGRDVRGCDRITRFELVLHDAEGFFVFRDGTVQQLDQRVGSSQIEISERELGLGQELDVVEIGRVRLRRGGVALDLTADLAPNIERPAAGKLRSEGVRICASARRGGDCAGAAGFGPVIRPRGVIVGVHDRKQGCWASRISARACS